MSAGGHPRVRLLLSCGDADEYQRTYAPRFAAEGAPIHTARLRPLGAEVNLVIELLDGQVMFDGLATVAAHLELGGPGFVLALVPTAEAPALSSEAREYLFEELRTAADEPEPVLEFWSAPLDRLRKRSS
jgi:hypothetical protein